MERRDTSLTFALCASLVVHAMLSLALFEMYARDVGGRIYLPALPRLAAVQEHADARGPLFWPEEDPRRRLGDSSGTGYAIDASPGDESMLAPKGELDQPFLSRDPAGPGRVGDPPSESLVPPGNDDDSNASPGQSSPSVALPPTPLAASRVQEAQDVSVGIPMERHSGPPDLPTSVSNDAQPPASPAPQPASSAIASASSDSSGSPAAAPTSAADPAPQGDSEIDPFSILGTMEFRRGATSVRFGRKHKLTRPHMTLGAQVDLVTLGPTRLVLKITTDPSGNVTSVQVHQPSGSESVDHIFETTAYEWWFEPPTGAGGAARSDTFLFRITIN